jgi:F-type H+-transporting ATPase subunit delta
VKRPPASAARRYARALLDVAIGKGDPRAVERDLAAVRADLAASPELRGALANPALSAERKKALVSAVWAGRSSELVGRLLALLTDRDRLDLVPLIVENYRLLVLAHEDVAPAQVVSAVTLDGEQLAAIEAVLRKATGTRVEVEASVDAELLGGVLVKLGGRHYDGSVRGRLKALRASLAGA